MSHQKSICGIVFDLTAPYAEGHVLNAVEAATLNQIRAENIGNNLREHIKELVAGHTAPYSDDLVAKAREMVAGADATYEFGANGGRGGARGPQDPVKAVAMGLAEATIRAAMQAKGLKLTSKQITEKTKELFEKREQEYRDKATAQMRRAGKDADDVLSELGL